MSKIFTLALLLSLPTVAAAVPGRNDNLHTASLFTALELNNLARLDEGTQPARVRRMETELAVLRDQVGRMKLDRLIDTVLTTGGRSTHAR